MTVKIYTLENPDTGEVRYLGKTVKSLTSRLSHHKGTHSTTHKDQWIRSLDKDPVIIKIDEVDEENWEFWESWWIQYFKFIGANLTNHTLGGDGHNGVRQSEKSNRKRSKSLSGRSRKDEVKKKISESHKGKSIPQEVREKISNTLSGRTMSRSYAPQMKMVAQIKNDEIVGIYKSISDAAKSVDGYKGAISNVCSGRANTSMGYKWSFIEDIVYPLEKSSELLENGSTESNTRGSLYCYLLG